MKFTLLKEFKEFAIKGNMIDIAIGVIIGTAFNKVVDVLVKEIFLPPLALLTNGANWENKRVILREAINRSGCRFSHHWIYGFSGRKIHEFHSHQSTGSRQ